MSPSLIAAAAGLVVLVWALWWHGHQMIEGRPDVVSLELAGSGERLYGLLDELRSDGRAKMRQALVIDRWIILGYVFFFGGAAGASISVIRMAVEGGGRTVGTILAILVAVLVALAGALDLMEDRALAGALAVWVEPPAQAMPATVESAAGRQAHRREMIAALSGPSAKAARAATAKFAILAGVVPAWLVTVVTIYAAHAMN